jgi:hypothetical protein
VPTAPNAGVPDPRTPPATSTPATPAPPAHLIDALAAAVHARDADSADLEAAVCAYVRTCRAAGVLPERVIVTLKRAADQVRPPHRRRTADQAVLDQVVRWCILEYYRAEAAG